MLNALALTGNPHRLTTDLFATPARLSPGERVYIAGPMTGRPRWNFDAFAAAAASIIASSPDT